MLPSSRPALSSAIKLFVGWDIETGGEKPRRHILYGLGGSVVGLFPDGIFELERIELGAWRVGTRRFSERCAKEYLRGFNPGEILTKEDNQEVLLRWAETEACQWQDLHTYPRISPFIYTPDSPDEPEDVREITIVLEYYAFRKKWFGMASAMGVPIEQVSDNPGFDAGWLLALAALHDDLPNPMYQRMDKNGEHHGYTKIGVPNKFLQGYAAAKEVTVEELMDRAPPAPCEHDHHPANDACTIAWSAAVAEGLVRKMW